MESTINAAIEHLTIASRDYRVWKGGLEMIYKEFLVTKPSKVSSQINACLLSIM